MSPSFLDSAYRASLARAAALERDERQRVYPQRIRDGKLERGDAEADFAAWQEIVRWCEGAFTLPEFLAPMELAAARALQAGEAAVAKAPHDPARLARRDALAAIHAALSGFRAWIDETNTALRARAAGRIAA